MSHSDSSCHRYGIWPSPFSIDLVTAPGVKGLSEPFANGGCYYWLESRPWEAGRQVVVCKTPDQQVELPLPWSARSRVHEYGGGTYAADGRSVFFVDAESQRVYKWDIFDSSVEPVSAECEGARVRWADLTLVPGARWLIAVRETHFDSRVENELIALDTTGSGTEKVLVTGHDFVSNGRVSSDGACLAWQCWEHPNMSWDTSLIQRGQLDSKMNLSHVSDVAGGVGESALQPHWSQSNVLHFISDRDGWWQVYGQDPSGDVKVSQMEGEYGAPQWVFGDERLAFTRRDQLVTIRSQNGNDYLAVTKNGVEDQLELGDFTAFSYLRPSQHGFVVIAEAPQRPAAVLDVALNDDGRLVSTTELVTALSAESLEEGSLSFPRSISFESSNKRIANGIFYPPTNSAAQPCDRELPPLILSCHGGPTSRFRPVLDLRGVQFFTSRGFAVMHVNYGGSSGYGRSYRELLKRSWGVVDVQDCIAAAVWLASTQQVDPSRMVIRGSSAGGFTVLRALTTSDIFAAGTSYYGVVDASALAIDTHKFESHYCDALIGLWPEEAQTYQDRSPINHLDNLATPLIIFQGLQDKVVPPNQSEQLVEALKAKSIPHSYVTFADESHGFKNVQTQRACLQAEISFYRQIFALEG